MHFASDNAGPAHPRVMDSLLRANKGYAMPYGVEAAMERVRSQLREIFEAPQAAIHLVATGTATNCLLLAAMAKPWQAIFCSEVAHIEEDECGAPEFFTGGARLSLVDAPDAMIDAAALRAKIASDPPGRRPQCAARPALGDDRDRARQRLSARPAPRGHRGREGIRSSGASRRGAVRQRPRRARLFPGGIWPATSMP